MSELIYKEESYKIIGICMEVHRILGHGFSEAIYQDALEVCFRQEKIPYSRNKPYFVKFKNEILPHHYLANFVVMDKIILEVKCVAQLTDEHISQTINFLKISECRLGLLINFARGSLQHQRLIY